MAENERQRRTTMYCCVPQCNTYFDKTVSFHTFPKTDAVLQAKWIKELNIGKQVSPFMRVCGKHFRDEDYFLNKSVPCKVYRLKKNSVPSVNLPIGTHKLKDNDALIWTNGIPLKNTQTNNVLQTVEKQRKPTILSRQNLLEAIINNGKRFIDIENQDYEEHNKFDTIASDKKIHNTSTERTDSSSQPVVPTGTVLTSAKFESLCRLCLKEGIFYSITNTIIDDLKVSFLLDYCLSLSVNGDVDKDLPQNICDNCLDSLCNSYQFKKQCYDNDIILRLINDSTRLRVECDTEDFFEVKIEVDNGNDETIENQFEDKTNDLILKITNEDNKSQKRSLITEKNDYNNTIDNKFEHIDNKENNKCQLVDNNNENIENIELVQHQFEAQNKENHSAIDQFDGEGIENSVKQETYDNNSRNIDKPHSYKCSTCGATFENLSDSKVHKRRFKHAELRRVTCEICGKVISRRSLAKHLRLHNKSLSDVYQCDICHRKFNLINNLKRHKMTHTGEKPFTCEKCGKGFIQKALLLAHLKSHSSIYMEEKRCQYCNRRFNRLSSLVIHLRKHSPNQTSSPYVCRKCLLTFLTRLDYKKHLLTHIQRQFLCNFCGKAFNRKALLDIHIRTHTGDKPYACKICHKKFGHAQRLKCHMLVHSDERPFKCRHCTWTFKQYPHLLTHLKTHTGEKPHTCFICHKTFATKSNLATHMRTHTGEKPFSCGACGSGFKYLNTLKKHRLYCI